MSESKNWFDVDRKGLAKLIERRGGGDGSGRAGGGKIAILFELIANALDADGVTRVEVVLEPEEGVPLATVVVRDDSPEGFADLSQAWTLFGESSRKSYANKRGRFCAGEKIVLALCNEASIVSTKGGVMFDARGRTSMRARRNRGTEFQGIARITRAELAEIQEGLKRLIVPSGVEVLVNGQKIPQRSPLKTVEATLPTEIADEEGNLRRSTRKTSVDIYEVLPGEVPMLYELGIPVVETGDKFHVDVQQKTVLTLERDNVTPGYLRDVRTLVVNAMHDHLTEDDGNATFVNEALADDDVTIEAANRALDLKFTKKRAIWDPSDPEANMNLESQGYTLIKGGQLTKEQWANAKKHDQALRPAGQIAPTKKALFGPGGKDTWVPREKWTPAMRAVVAYSADVCRELTGSRVEVSVLSDITESWAACYGSQGLVFNLGRLGHDFFDECVAPERIAIQGHAMSPRDYEMKSVEIMRPTRRLNQLLIHELGHNEAPNHLSEKYHEALCNFGAKLTSLALDKPELFRRLAVPHERGCVPDLGYVIDPSLHHKVEP